MGHDHACMTHEYNNNASAQAAQSSWSLSYQARHKQAKICRLCYSSSYQLPPLELIFQDQQVTPSIAGMQQWGPTSGSRSRTLTNGRCNLPGSCGAARACIKKLLPSYKLHCAFAIRGTVSCLTCQVLSGLNIAVSAGIPACQPCI
jgi:hypothetical protein